MVSDELAGWNNLSQTGFETSVAQAFDLAVNKHNNSHAGTATCHA